jgi:hypothetical protein
MRAELDAIVCSGAMRGTQHTYALLDERALDAALDAYAKFVGGPVTLGPVRLTGARTRSK